MRSWYKQILKFLVFLCISFFLFWLVYRDQNWSDLRRALEEEVNYSWVAVVLCCRYIESCGAGVALAVY